MPPLPLRTRHPKLALLLLLLLCVAALVSVAGAAAAAEVRDRGSPAANNDEGLRVAREGDTETAFKLRLCSQFFSCQHFPLLHARDLLFRFQRFYPYQAVSSI
jgi:hypothetical protein